MHLLRIAPCGLAFLLLSACGDKSGKGAELAPPEVTVMSVSAGDVPFVPEFVGQTESSRQVEIRARVSGFLEKREYREGAMVREGQLLFQLDRKPFEAQLQVARAQLAQSEAARATAQANLNRIEPLAAKNAVSQKDKDDAIGSARTAAAGVEAAKASVIRAELDLSYTTIKSPVAGLSSFAKVAEGTYLDAQNSLLTYVAALSPMRINFSVSENQILLYQDLVKAGKLVQPQDQNYKVEVLMADGSVFEESGRLTFSDASFSQETGTFLARAEVPNAKALLRPGQFVRVRLHGALQPKGILVPQRAVLQTSQGNIAFVVDDKGHAQPRPLRLEGARGEQWLVSAGLKPGDTLVVDGGMKLRPDTPVKVTRHFKPGEALSPPPPAAPAANASAAR